MSKVLKTRIQQKHASEQEWLESTLVPLAEEADNEDIDELKQTIDNLTIGTLTETDPTVPAWAKEETKPTYTADEIDGINTVVESYVEETILGGEW